MAAPDSSRPGQGQRDRNGWRQPLDRICQHPLLGWHGPLCGPVLSLLLLAAAMPSAQAGPWKQCSFNDRPMPCRDRHDPDGSVRIVWQDGLAMTYRLIQAGFPISILRDSLGGRWQRQILAQGNAVFVNTANGNRIVVPLR